MKELVLFVDGQNVGPFPAEEVKARMAAGEFAPDTLCIEPDGTEWQKLEDVFPPERKTVVRIARKTQEEEAEMKSATSEKLDPEVRKKLMLYNLADAISVDKFTPVQAEAAIRVYEDAQKKSKKIKIAAGIGGFVAACALSVFISSGINIGEDAAGGDLKLFETIFETPAAPEVEKTRKRVASEIERLNELREEVGKITFAAPRGNGDPRQTFLGNVEIKNPDISTVTGTFDFSALTEKLSPAMLSSASVEAVRYARVESQADDLMEKQNELFAVCSRPLWTDKEIREAITTTLASEFPANPDVPESMEFAKRLKSFSVSKPENQIAAMVKRCGELARSKEVFEQLQKTVREKLSKAPTLPPDDKNSRNRSRRNTSSSGNSKENAASRTAAWAKNDLAPFIERFADFLYDNALYYSPEARKKAWGDFVQNELPTLEELLQKHEAQRVPVPADGAFIFDGRNSRNILAAVKFAGAGTVYFDPDSEQVPLPVKITDLKTNRRVLTPEDVLMDERYKVVSKEKTGGVPVMTSSKILSRDIYIVRTTPEWFYLTVERVSDDPTSSKKRTVLLGVPEDFYSTVEVEDEIPMEKLLTFTRFTRTAESPSTGRLILIPKEKLEEVKTAQAEAGIAFPPPPEKFVPEQPEEPKTDAPEASEDAEAAPEASEEVDAEATESAAPESPETEAAESASEVSEEELES